MAEFHSQPLQPEESEDIAGELSQRLVLSENQPDDNDELKKIMSKNKFLIPDLLMQLQAAKDEITQVKYENDKITKQYEKQLKRNDENQAVLDSVLNRDEIDSPLTRYCNDDLDTLDLQLEGYVGDSCLLSPGSPTGDPINCPANCGMNVFFNIMHDMKYYICTRMFLIHLNISAQNRLREPANSCLRFHCDLLDVGLVKKVVELPVQNPDQLPGVLETVMTIMEELGDPGMLLVSYSNNIGHFVKVTPEIHNLKESGFFDFQLNRVWPECDSRCDKITKVTILTIDKLVAPEWTKKCGKVVCRDEVKQGILATILAQKKPVSEEGLSARDQG